MSGAVLRQMRLDGGEALPLRTSRGPVAPLREDPVAAAVQVGYEEGLRRGLEEGGRRGYESGHAEGLAAAEAALAEAQQELRQQAAQVQQQHAAALREALQVLREAVDGFVATAEEDLVALCLEGLCKCFGDAAAHAGSVRAQVHASLAQWRGAPPLAVHVNPADLQLLQEAELPLACVADPAVAAGGCIVRGTQGALDARLDSILAQASQLLLAACRQRQAAAP